MRFYSAAAQVTDEMFGCRLKLPFAFAINYTMLQKQQKKGLFKLILLSELNSFTNMDAKNAIKALKIEKQIMYK